MNDLEDRLRATLHDRADSVPPSLHAQADLERRITRRGRGVVLAAAAAAAVVAGVAIPVALNQDGGSTGGQAATTTSNDDWSVRRIVAGPVVIGEFTRDGVRWSAVLMVETGDQPGPDGVEMVCTRQMPLDQPESGSGGCLEAPRSWPEPHYSGAPEGTMGWVSGTVSTNDALPDQFTVIAAPQVATLEFRRVDGTSVPAELKAETPGVKVFLVEMAGGFAESTGHIARDAAGNVLESVGL